MGNLAMTYKGHDGIYEISGGTCARNSITRYSDATGYIGDEDAG
jgi:hypothetical protein